MNDVSEGSRKALALISNSTWAAVARLVGLSQPAIRQHANGVRSPKSGARRKWEKAGIGFHDWDLPVGESAPSAAELVRATASRLTIGAGRDVLLGALASSTALFVASGAWASRDRIAALHTMLAAVRALLPTEPAPAPTSDGTWPGLRDTLLAIVALYPKPLAPVRKLIKDFEKACAPPRGHVDLQKALRGVLKSAHALLRGNLVDRERVALQGLHVAAGKLTSKLEARESHAADPRWAAFKRAVFPVVMKHPPAWAALLAYGEADA